MTNAERRCTLLQKAVDPPEGARSDLDIFLEFSARMNLRDAAGNPLVQYTDAEGAFNEWREISRGCIPDYSGMTYQKLAERGGIQHGQFRRSEPAKRHLLGDARVALVQSVFR